MASGILIASRGSRQQDNGIAKTRGNFCPSLASPRTEREITRSFPRVVWNYLRGGMSRDDPPAIFLAIDPFSEKPRRVLHIFNAPDTYSDSREN